jgi:E3 ubiquitin-protein ligase HERC1
MKPSLGLFIPSPNMRADGDCCFVPDPRPVDPGSRRERMYFYTGLLFALCYISKLPEPFRFARFVWNALTGRPVTISDIYAVDTEFEKLMLAMENCEENRIDANLFEEVFTNKFEVENSAGELVPLVPGGSAIRVTFNHRREFIQRAQKFRLREFTTQLAAMRHGFSEFFAPAVASLLSPWELELFVCGPPVVDISELRKNCQVERSDHEQMLWRVLETFSNEDRMLFIKFGSGRMSLPPPGMSWSQKLRIDFRSYDDRPDARKPLPTAGTCGSQIHIPRYRSEEVMAQKIRAAIRFGGDIEQDHSANLRDLSEFT